MHDTVDLVNKTVKRTMTGKSPRWDHARTVIGWTAHGQARFHANEAIGMRLSDVVMVRTRSLQRQESGVTEEMLDKSVGVWWKPTGVTASFGTVMDSAANVAERIRAEAATQHPNSSRNSFSRG